MTAEVLRDEGLSKEQFKELLGHMPLYTKSAALLMYSSGIRIGEALQLKIDDLHLDEDPPCADVRAKYTMGARRDRRIWFSYEARDAIEEWLKVKDTRRKKIRKIIEGGEDLVFGYSTGTWMYSWNKARKEINSGAGSHTLRRSFRVSMLRAGVPDTILRVLMGYKDPLADVHGGIHKIPLKEMARIYKKYMHAVSIYDSEDIQPVESPDSTPGDKASSGGERR